MKMPKTILSTISNILYVIISQIYDVWPLAHMVEHLTPTSSTKTHWVEHSKQISPKQHI